MISKTANIKTISSLSMNYQSIFLNLLATMNLGKLELTLTSGERLEFGSKDFIPSDQIARIRIRSDRFFKRCVLFGDIGFGEAYTEGDWDTDNITKVIRWMILNRENNPGISESKVSSLFIGTLKLLNRFQHLLKKNDLSGSVKNIAAHYDLGNRLFEIFLDPSMTYSSADFSSGAKSLEEAQIAKFDRLARSIQIKPGERVLEIGGGWGAFAIHLAKKYGAHVTTITVSKEQLAKIQFRAKEEGLVDQIDAKFLDYRKVQGQFDKIVSIEMIEAVGHKYLKYFFEVAERVLKPNGMMGLQAITAADYRYETVRKGVDWIQKHIFPGSLIPSIGALCNAASKSSRLQMFSLHDMGADYALTLKNWRDQFNHNHLKIKSLGFDERFMRAWNYYFSYCEAAFAERHISVVQIAYTRPNNTLIHDSSKHT